MKVYQTNEIKNISIVGSSGSGKTTLTEAMLFESGVIKRRGSVASKNTVSDYFPVEQDYGYSIFPTVFYAEWMNRKLNMIDCPGADDFVGGLITSLSVTDTALMLINAQHGVEVGTQNQYRQIAQLRKPCMFVVNQLDHDKADFEKSVDDLRQHFGKKVVLIQYPIQTGANFNAVIDVLLMKMYTWKPEGGEPAISEIPANEMERASELHNILVEAAAENEEGLMEKYFSDGKLTEEEMRMGIRFGLLHRDVFPVFCLSAGKDMGVRRLMEFLGNIVPYVRDSPAPITTKGQEVPPLKENNTSIYVFKTSIEPHIGEVSFFKVMSGSVKEGDDLYNATRQSKERLTQLYNVCGSIRTKVEELVAGDIGATVKLKNTRTSNTLNGKNADGQFSFIKYPEWKFRRAISAVNQAEEEKLSEVLTRMHEEDPTWIIEYSKELKQLIVHGQGEFHLKTLKWRIENNDKIAIQFANPRIPYRETITKIARADYRHKKQSGGSGQFGEVHLIIEPYVEGVPEKEVYKMNGQEFKISVRDKQEYNLEWGGKLVFINSIVGGVIDTRFLPAIQKGVMDCMEQGPLTGSYARDIRVIVYDGKMHPVDSNEISFRLAGKYAFSEAFKNAGSKVLEPIYDVEVLVPSDSMGDVMSDLQGRRAMIMGMESDNGMEKIFAKVPLKEMNSYSISLSSNTRGRASFNMKFAGYELLPSDVQDALLKEYEKNKKQD